MLIKRVEEPENIVWSRKGTIDDELSQAAELCLCKVHRAAALLDVLQIPVVHVNMQFRRPEAGTQRKALQ